MWRFPLFTKRHTACILALIMANDPRSLFILACQATGMTQLQMGEALGVSRRTVQRFVAHGPPSYHLRDLAKVVYPHDRDLAAQIAQWTRETLVSLGLEAPPAPPPVVAAAPPPPPPPPPADSIVDAIVCAAAEASDAKPSEVRPTLLAAFARAKEIGVDVTFVERVLRAQLVAPEPVRSGSPKGVRG